MDDRNLSSKLFAKTPEPEEISQDYIQALNSLAKSNREIAEATMLEIDSKNRVDITLAEYKSLHQTIADLHQQVKVLDSDGKIKTELLVKLGFPYDKLSKIELDSVKVDSRIDPKSMKTHYIIDFYVEDSELRRIDSNA